MEKNILWEAICTLGRAERRAFERFVASPFFNRKSQVTALCAYLLSCLENKQTPEPEAAFAAAFPKTPFSDQKLRLANSDLLSLLEQYWLHAEKFADPARNKIQLAAIYRRRLLDKHARISRREAAEALQGSSHRDAEHLRARYELEFETYQAAASAKRYENFNLQEIATLLDQEYCAALLRHVCLALSHQAVFKAEYHFPMLPAVLQLVETQHLRTLPAIGPYYHACRFLSEGPETEQHFHAFQEVFSGQEAQLPPSEQRNLVLLALNFGIKKLNVGSGDYWPRATLALYREALQRELLLENGHLSRFAYNNIVGIAARIGEIDWADQFIQDYRPLLERRYREAAFSLNSARVAYLRRDFGKALLHLQHADYKDFISSLNAKILLMKIYFESGETDLLESHIDSTHNYIRRQRAAGYHREMYLNMLRFTRSVLRVNRFDALETEALRKQIESEKALYEREWLLKQLG